MATSPGLAWSLANGISQQEFDQNLANALRQAEAAGATDAQLESAMQQWGISAADVARAAGVPVSNIESRLAAATPTTQAEIDFDAAARAELAGREAQWAEQQKQNEVDWAAQQRANEAAWAEQQRLNAIKNQQQIAANQKAWADKQRQNEIAWADKQRQNEIAWAAQQARNQTDWAAQQRANDEAWSAQQRRNLGIASDAPFGTTPMGQANTGGIGTIGAGGSLAENFQRYQGIPIGAQYNPAVTPGGASPYELIMGQMSSPTPNPYSNFVAGTALGGYNPAIYDQLLRRDIALTEPGRVYADLGGAGSAGDGFGGAGGYDSGAVGDGGFSGMSNSGEGGPGSMGGWAKGGLVDRVFGPDPKGADEGAGYLQVGEYVIKKSSVNKYGRGLLDMINDGKIPAKKMKSLLD